MENQNNEEGVFTLTFFYKNKRKIIKFKKGEDVFKLADVFAKICDDVGIKYTITEE